MDVREEVLVLLLQQLLRATLVLLSRILRQLFLQIHLFLPIAHVSMQYLPNVAYFAETSVLDFFPWNNRAQRIPLANFFHSFLLAFFLFSFIKILPRSHPRLPGHCSLCYKLHISHHLCKNGTSYIPKYPLILSRLFRCSSIIQIVD